MTRAAEAHLVIAGAGPRGKAKELLVADMARAGLDGAMSEAAAPWREGEKIWRLGQAWRATGGARVGAPKEPDAPTPWLRMRAVPERAPAPVNPSRAAAAPLAANGDAKRKPPPKPGAASAGVPCCNICRKSRRISAATRRGAFSRGAARACPPTRKTRSSNARWP